MTYRIAKTYPDALFSVPRELLGKMEEAGDGELRILLHTLSLLSGGAMEERALTDALLSSGFDSTQITSALAFWRGCGILKAHGKLSPAEAEAPKPAEPVKPAERVPADTKMVDADEQPFYSALELGVAAENDPSFKALVDFGQKKLGKIFNTSELARLWSFMDYLKLPMEVVMLVIEDCCAKGKTSLRYITKVCNAFHDEGITSYEKAEAYYLARQESAVFEREIRTLFGLGDRKLTAAEEEILETWRVKWSVGRDLIDAAYEATVASAKKPSMKYMHRILESWHAAGVVKASEIAEKTKKNAKKADKSYDLDDFFDAAVAKGLKEN